MSGHSPHAVLKGDHAFLSRRAPRCDLSKDDRSHTIRRNPSLTGPLDATLGYLVDASDAQHESAAPPTPTRHGLCAPSQHMATLRHSAALPHHSVVPSPLLIAWVPCHVRSDREVRKELFPPLLRMMEVKAGGSQRRSHHHLPESLSEPSGSDPDSAKPPKPGSPMQHGESLGGYPDGDVGLVSGDGAETAVIEPKLD